MSESETDSRVAVVVTTERRGVFFGFLPGVTQVTVPDDRKLTLADAQMCVYWDEDVQGVTGLAATGPSRRSKVSRPVPELAVESVTSVMRATGEATKAWQDRPWS